MQESKLEQGGTCLLGAELLAELGVQGAEELGVQQETRAFLQGAGEIEAQSSEFLGQQADSARHSRQTSRNAWMSNFCSFFTNPSPSRSRSRSITSTHWGSNWLPENLWSSLSTVSKGRPFR